MEELDMNVIDIEQINNQFSLENEEGRLFVREGEGDIPVVEIKNKFATALISLQGAHLLSWKPHNEGDVIWLSEEAKFAQGKSVRGGIPICWPWFGAHGENDSYPAHGFARTVLWQIIDTGFSATGETYITFRLDTTELEEKLQSMWPQATVVEYRLTIGTKLVMELMTKNNSNKNIVIGQALHTYFSVAEVSDTQIFGLEDKTYLDKVDDFTSKIQKGSVTINSEVDRVYLNTTDDVVIDDKNRKIRIEKQGSSSTVVWNPWQEVADKMGDLGEDGYHKMLCVESANAMDDTITIAPKDKATLLVTYSIDK